MARYKSDTVTTMIHAAIETFYGDLQGLAEEIRESLDSVPEPLQGTDRNTTMGNTADVLEGLEDPGAPDEFPNDTISVDIMVRGGKKRGSESRAVRRDNAVAHANAALDALRGWIENQEIEENPEDNEEEREERAALAEIVEGVEDYCNTLEEHIGEAEECEFPGMRG